MKTTWLVRFISCGRLAAIGFVALIFAAAVGGASFGMAADFNLGLVQGLVCPQGGTLSYSLGAAETIEEFPSASDPIGNSTTGRSFSVRCDRAGETIASGDGLLVKTLGVMLGGYFLLCFIPLLLGSSFLLFVFSKRV